VAIAIQLNFLRVMADAALDDPNQRAFAQAKIDRLLAGDLRALTLSIPALVDIARMSE
jgi:hypothetical protein